jgi:hypothetical protein
MYRLNAFYKMNQEWFANASARIHVAKQHPTLIDLLTTMEPIFTTATKSIMPNVFDLFVSMGYLQLDCRLS